MQVTVTKTVTYDFYIENTGNSNSNDDIYFTDNNSNKNNSIDKNNILTGVIFMEIIILITIITITIIIIVIIMLTINDNNCNL